MPIPRRAFLLCFALALAACTSERERTEALLARSDPDRLRTDAAMLYKEYFAGSGAGFAAVPESRWPRSFQKLEPLRVGAYRDGFALVKETRADSEAGLFIIPLHAEHEPSPQPGARYERLRNGIYWYSFGR